MERAGQRIDVEVGAHPLEMHAKDRILLDFLAVLDGKLAKR